MQCTKDGCRLLSTRTAEVTVLWLCSENSEYVHGMQVDFRFLHGQTVRQQQRSEENGGKTEFWSQVLHAARAMRSPSVTLRVACVSPWCRLGVTVQKARTRESSNL